MSRKKKRGKAKKINAEKAFCSAVAKLAKDNKEEVFECESDYKHDYQAIKKNIHNAFWYLENMPVSISKCIYFKSDNNEAAFVKAGKKIIKLELQEISKDDSLEIKKASFVKPTLLFEEVSYKEAKANNTIEFELVKWISEHK